MAENKTDLVREIESWIGTFDKMGIAQFIVEHDEAKALLFTLQRAREALRWIPFPENDPQNAAVLYLVSGKRDDGEREVEICSYDFETGIFDTFLEVEAFQEEPAPYTPPREVEK